MANAQTCFVLMPFKAPFSSYYREIYVPAIVAAGLVPVQAGEIMKPGAISKQIWNGIHEASVCLAELTRQNPNVMYELGIAHALGKPVVSIVQSMKFIPFDLQHLRHIVYDTSAAEWATKLRSEIAEMLRVTLLDPTDALAFPSISNIQGSRNDLSGWGNSTPIAAPPFPPITVSPPRQPVPANYADEIMRFAEYMVQGQHLSITTPGIVTREVVVAFLNHSYIQVELKNNGTLRPIQFQDIRDVQLLEKLEPRGDEAARWIREFSRYLITGQHVEVTTTDQVVERAIVTQVGIGFASLMTVQGNAFVMATYPQVLSVKAREE